MGSVKMRPPNVTLLLILAIFTLYTPQTESKCSPDAKKQCWHAYKRICIYYGYGLCPMEDGTSPIISQKKGCWFSVNRVYESARRMIKFTQICFCTPKNCNPYQGSTEDVKLVEAADTYEQYLDFVEASNGTARNIVDFDYKYDKI